MVTTRLELEGLVDLFDRYDDAYGAWLASLQLCQYLHGLRESSWHEVCAETLHRAHLTARESAVFMSAIQLYLYSGNERYAGLAEAHASSAEDREVIALARGDAGAISLPEAAHTDPGIRAWQYYRYGKLHRDEQALAVAHRLFIEQDDARGIADVLYIRAQLAAVQGDGEGARRLAGRSVNVLEALGETEKAASVRRWLNVELAAE